MMWLLLLLHNNVTPGQCEKVRLLLVKLHDTTCPFEQVKCGSQSLQAPQTYPVIKSAFDKQGEAIVRGGFLDDMFMYFYKGSSQTSIAGNKFSVSRKSLK